MTKQSKWAMTLVEVLVAVVLGSLVMGAAYAVWTHIRRDMSRSTTRQLLQKQARQALDVIAADLKAVKNGTMVPPASSNPEDWTLEFDRFEDQKDANKFASQQFFHVKIRYKKPLLYRDEGRNGLLVTKILADNVQSLDMQRGAAAAAGTRDELAKQSHVDIVMTATRMVPGLGTEEFHVERTTVVMRDEFYKTVNANYLDNQQLTSMSRTDVVKVDDGAAQFADEFGEDALKSLNRAQLDDLLAAQENAKADAQQKIDRVNTDLGNVDDGGDWWRLWWNHSDTGVVNDLRNRVKRADSPDALREVIGTRTDTQTNTLTGFINTKDQQFFKNTFGVEESSLTREVDVGGSKVKEVDLYRKAYELKLLDRQMEGAYNKLSDADKQKNYPNGLKTMADDLRGDAWKQEIRESFKDPAEAQRVIAYREAENQRVLAIYDNNCKLDWMGTYGNETQEVQAYNAAKQVNALAQSKLDLVIARDKADGNITTINNVITSGNYIKD